MMKRTFALLLACMLALGCCMALGEAEVDTAMFESMRSRYAGITFTMDAFPEVGHDSDLIPDDSWKDLQLYVGWQDKTQLRYYDDDGEWQYHLADVTLLLDSVRADLPDAGDDEVGTIAIRDFAMMCAYITGADLSKSRPASLPEAKTGGMPSVSFTFTYADTPGVTYRCVGLLDGTKAAVLMGSVDARFEAMLAEFGPITPEQEASIAARLTPETVTIGPLSFTFPAQTGVDLGNNSVWVMCFTDAYHMLSVEYMPFDFTIILDPAHPVDEELMSYCQYVGGSYLKQSPHLYASMEVEMLAPGFAVLKLHGTENVYSEPEETWNIMFQSGCYTVTAAPTADGMALLESIRPVEDADPTQVDNLGTVLLKLYGIQ